MESEDRLLVRASQGADLEGGRAGGRLEAFADDDVFREELADLLHEILAVRFGFGPDAEGQVRTIRRQWHGVVGGEVVSPPDAKLASTVQNQTVKWS